MTRRELAAKTAKTLAKKWMADPQQEADMARTVESALAGGDPEGAKKAIRRLYDDPTIPFKPSAYLYKHLKPYAAIRKPSAKEAPEESIEAEIADEEATYQNEPRVTESMMRKASPGYKWKWLEPRDPDLGDYLVDPARTHTEYIDNTFISLYREAKERGTSIHQLCRERGLKYELLATGNGKGG